MQGKPRNYRGTRQPIYVSKNILITYYLLPFFKWEARIMHLKTLKGERDQKLFIKGGKHEHMIL